MGLQKFGHNSYGKVQNKIWLKSKWRLMRWLQYFHHFVKHVYQHMDGGCIIWTKMIHWNIKKLAHDPRANILPLPKNNNK
jgi:hypothetical protein